jgi:hypothetical protein
MLKVTDDWLTWFQKERIELVTTIDNRELMSISVKKEFQGEKISYNSILAIIAKFRHFFDWLDITEIRLEHSEEIDKAELQFYRAGEFDIWRDKVLRDFSFALPEKDDVYEDSSNIFYNYRLKIDGTSGSLYMYSTRDVASIFTYYDEDADKTTCTVNIELRKNLFEVDDKFDVNLPKDYLEHNSRLLRLAMGKMEDYQLGID